jgi:hypothetical protein
VAVREMVVGLSHEVGGLSGSGRRKREDAPMALARTPSASLSPYGLIGRNSLLIASCAG